MTTLTMEAILRRARVLPVVTLTDSAVAVDLAHALVAGGLSVIEVTLRTAAGLDAINAISRSVPNCIIGAGTVLTAEDFDRAADAGATFAVSPGGTRGLYEASARLRLPFLPGVTTPSEIMRGCDAGCNVFKFFPAEDIGGPSFLKTVYAPLPHARFCPSGGISAERAAVYATLPNVIAIAGTWMVREKLISERDWASVTALSASTSGIPLEANAA